MPVLPKKIIKTSLFLFTFYFLLFTFFKPIKASPESSTEMEPQQFPVSALVETRLRQFEAKWYNNANQIYWENKVFSGSDEDLNGDKFSLYQATNKINEVIYFLGGPLTEEAVQKSGENQGAIPITTNLIASLINTPPVNTGEYLADLGSSLGLAKPAYAQGIGFKALTPIMRIWKAFRNVSYMAFVIIFVALGFMIMFRTKINPQTVISIQESLPRIVITLLIITFSYAIASLMIDLIYIAIYLTVAVLSGSNLFEDGGKAALERIFNMNIWAMVYDERNIFIANPAKAVGDIVGAISGGFGGIIIQGLTHAVLAVIIFMSLFKLFISLLTAYVSIILSVIFSPFSLLLNVFPGSNSFTAWLRNLLANIAVFPVVVIMLLLAAILIGRGPEGENYWGISEGVGYTYGQPAEEQGGWTPPLLTAFGPGIGYGASGTLPSSDAILALIGVGIILLLPHTVDLVKKTLKVEVSPLAGILGAVPGAVMGAPGKAVMTGTQFLYQAHYARDTLRSVLGPLVGKTEEAIKKIGERRVSRPDTEHG